ncbi:MULTISPECIES: fasciclin domain-containing protein [unclassified Coleofasciculus]|uniref:fasciclin domain-containing protein n=1 Tax=Cyanophyceae TaxID=3028117 RepID=UPI00168A2D94|nr:MULTISPECIES: fasciclin domain-containing protein [unclassified Coleofasciculus]MBD2085914.1 fasciclin domain-containing protein [Coleofasciculus sp. FACHB-542]MBD2539517.1 fasciclin domain-containing protein [Coleofasciculus sp. FACHB-SPT36]
MKSLGKLLFSVIGVGSLVVLSACGGQPGANTANQAPASDSTATTESPVAEAPATTTSPSAEVSPTASPGAEANGAATEDKNLGELAQTAASNGSFTTLTKAVQAAGLTDQLTGDKPYTVFAPTDAAFAALPAGTVDKLLQPANKQTLVKLLSYHVVPGKISSTELKSGEVKTVEGTPVTVKVDSASSEITINNAKVIQPNIPASNGVIHVVDKVILPPDIQASLGSSQTAQ